MPPPDKDFNFLLALNKHQARDYQAADQLYRAILDDRPDHFQAQHNLGVLELQRGHASSAVVLLAEAVRLAPKEPTYRSNLALALQAAGDSPHALEEAEAACHIDPFSAVLQCNLGNVQLGANRIDLAIEAYSKAIQLDSYAIDAYLNLSHCKERLGKPAEALNAIEQGLAYQSNDPKLNDRKGSILLKSGDFRRGFQHWDGTMHPRNGLNSDENLLSKNHLLTRGEKLHIKFGANFIYDMMFARFLFSLKQKGIVTIVSCPKSYFGLLTSNVSVDRIHVAGDQAIKADDHIDARRIPKLLEIQSIRDVQVQPYLFPDPVLGSKLLSDLGIDKKTQYIVIHRKFNSKLGIQDIRSSLETLKDRLMRTASVSNHRVVLAFSKEVLENNCPQISVFQESTSKFSKPLKLDQAAAIIGYSENIDTNDKSLAVVAGCLGVRTSLALESQLVGWEWISTIGKSSLWYPSVEVNLTPSA